MAYRLPVRRRKNVNLRSLSGIRWVVFVFCVWYHECDVESETNGNIKKHDTQVNV
jgi:hypothetical protein